MFCDTNFNQACSFLGVCLINVNQTIVWKKNCFTWSCIVQYDKLLIVSDEFETFNDDTENADNFKHSGCAKIVNKQMNWNDKL